MAKRRRKKKITKTRFDEKFVLFCIISLFISASLGGAISSAAKKGQFDLGIFLLVFFISLMVLLTISTILSTPKVKGAIGERRVAKKLNKVAKKYNGKVINDVIVQGEDGKTSQIDHILFTPYMIFVVETKNYAGRIYGSDGDQYWTQVLAYGHTKNKLYNPVKQNMTHIYRLKETLGKNCHMESVIVIVSGNLNHITSKHAYSPRGLKNLISKDDPIIFSDEQIDYYYNKVIEFKNNPVISKREHVKNIKQMKKDVENNICPRCGGKLVLRVSNIDGSHFYGCENFPKCNFTKK